MSYMLIGDSGTVVFEKTGTVTGESAQMSTKVTSNPVEGGGDITDHAVLEPLQFKINGTVSNSIQYSRLEAMWRNRDLLTYRGIEAYNNLLITSFARTRSSDNEGGFSFEAGFTRINIASSAMASVSAPSMSQQDAGAATSDDAALATKQATQNGMVPLSSSYEAYTQSFDSVAVNTGVGASKTNPSYAGYPR